MNLKSLSLSSLCLALCAAPVTAQLGTIEKNTTSKTLVRCMATNNDTMVLTADGTMWALVFEQTSTTSRYLELRYSTDQGATWVDNNYQLQGGKVQHSSLGAMALGRSSNLIHILFTAKTGRNGANLYWSTYYQAFDVVRRAFVGSPTLLADGTSSNNQFFAHAIKETGKGTLVAAITGHRSGGLGIRGWSCGLWVKKKGGNWPTSGVQVNLGSGVQPSMEVVGEEVHMTMRDTTGGYGPIYRRYDADTNKFAVGVVRCWPSSQGTVVGAGNLYSFMIDEKGGKWLLWPEGVVSGNRNAALNLSYAAPGKGDLQADWTKNELFKDSKIKGGNNTERFYTLARTVGDRVYVFYSKPTENFNTLYHELWQAGRRIIPRALVVSKTTTNDRFPWLAGVARRHQNHSPMVLTWGARTAGTNSGQVDVWRVGGRGFYTVYGSGCRGSLTETPQVTSNGLPTQGGTSSLTWTGLPKSAGCWTGIGLAATPSFLFGPDGCTLDMDLALGATFGTTTAAGAFTVSRQVPATPSLVGLGVFIQLLCAEPGSTGGFITTSAVAWRF